MKKQKRTSQEKGITLVALIITIIVLLILAVVAIRAVSNDGIISHAKNAQTRYEQEQAKELGILSGYELELAKNSPASLSDEIIGTKFSKTTFVKDEKGKIFVVPAGYTIVKDDTTANTVEVDKGVVIKDDNNNQFVWVPTTTDIVAYGLNTSSNREPDVVTGVDPSTVNSANGSEYDAVIDNLDDAGCTEDLNNDGVVNAYDFKIQLTNEFNEMATSVNKYDGFYVGRYEMSYSGTAKSVSGVESAMNKTSDYNWYGLYAKAKTYTNSANSVVSSMIYGSQYDAMMTWMGSAANSTIGDNRNQGRTTGTCPTDKINNIYDLYGNSFEWTQEAYYTCARVRRGGFCYGSYSPSYRNGSSPTYTDSSGDLGSRLSLYIK